VNEDVLFVDLSSLVGKSCLLPISKRAFERFHALFNERGRDQMLNEILWEFWDAPQWISCAPQELVMYVGSSIPFVIGGVKEVIWEEARGAALAWAKEGDWSAIADYVDKVKVMDKNNDTERQILTMISGIIRKEDRRKTKKPTAGRGRRRPRSQAATGAGIKRLAHVFFLMETGANKSAAVAATAAKFGKDQSQIYADLRGRYAEFAEVWVRIFLLIQVTVARFAHRCHELGLMTPEQGETLLSLRDLLD
jgi:hypothetical protein